MYLTKCKNVPGVTKSTCTTAAIRLKHPVADFFFKEKTHEDHAERSVYLTRISQITHKDRITTRGGKGERTAVERLFVFKFLSVSGIAPYPGIQQSICYWSSVKVTASYLEKKEWRGKLGVDRLASCRHPKGGCRAHLRRTATSLVKEEKIEK